MMGGNDKQLYQALKIAKAFLGKIDAKKVVDLSTPEQLQESMGNLTNLIELATNLLEDLSEEK